MENDKVERRKTFKENFHNKQKKEKSIIKARWQSYVKNNSFFFCFRKKSSTKSSTILSSGEKCWWSSMVSSSGNRVFTLESSVASWHSCSSFCGGWIFLCWRSSLSVSFWQQFWITAILSFQNSSLNQKTGAALKRNCMSKSSPILSTSSCAWQEQLHPFSIVARKNRHS